MIRLLPHFFSRYPDLTFVAVAGLAACLLAAFGIWLARKLDAYLLRLKELRTRDAVYRGMTELMPILASPRRWILGCYFDFSQALTLAELEAKTSANRRCTLRWRSDGVVYFALTSYHFDATESGIAMQIEERFLGWLGDETTAPPTTSAEFWRAVDAQVERLGGWGLVVDVGQRRACDEAKL